MVSLYFVEGNGAFCRFPAVDNLTVAISSRVGELPWSGCGRYTGPDPDVYFLIRNIRCWRVGDDEITIGNGKAHLAVRWLLTDKQSLTFGNNTNRDIGSTHEVVRAIWGDSRVHQRARHTQDDNGRKGRRKHGEVEELR